nr:immunoglobulin heavy chain junction region [Mus musculus]MBK4198523.1 immunoglobulin heavy chain junction region [Mus musculus]MBK4198524.1 immunoglobulin heavy chain junction region [Mus musculus]MBK4198525.1 immunoglobulin heavy chain junction region [Mus musculus]
CARDGYYDFDYW